MRMSVIAAAVAVVLAGCVATPAPKFCYELSAQEQKPGQNCIPNGGTSH